MELTIFTDGGSLNNPGPAASAFVIYQNKTVVFQAGVAIGTATNNDAEYTALIKALTKVSELLQNKTISDIEKISVFSDSKLMVSQVNGLWKVKHGPIREYILHIRNLEQEIKPSITYTYVPREQNTVADGLVKKALGR